MEPRREEDQAKISISLLYDDPNPPNGERKIDHGQKAQNHVILPQTLDQPKPRIDHPLQPSIPPPNSILASAEFPKITTLTPATPLPAANFRHRECLKNHAISVGGHVVDGCGEFMPDGDEGAPEFFRCAACGCHRNFHRKEIVVCSGTEPRHMASFQYNHGNGNGLNYGQIRHAVNSIPQQTLLHQSRHHGVFSPEPARPVMVMFGGGGEVESSSEDLGAIQRGGGGDGGSRQSSKKRFRTKFSEEQKERMMGFAEKLGWKMQKGDEDEVVKFCEEVGVKRQAFKVWIHNNKRAIRRKQPLLT
ncbi:zinc-finger homeodomain protein 5-like isoform X2 [Rhodamnia argentea]|uniref:Zinc-finger homeodomain protein 5-like isoform X2 n=1 Tax=Rhodamnia argentea TaxID=178133 RepID=A0ABM3GX73_9MYRT|nr:zinc-finger homeodomain protein 5-like isoform X2 [Rhodamnia argentea]